MKNGLYKGFVFIYRQDLRENIFMGIKQYWVVVI